MKKLFLSIIAVLALSLCFVACGGSKITVTFDGNGGVTKDGQTQVVKQIDVNGSYVVPQFYREGYTQIGWDSDIKTLTKNTVVKAQWKAITYTVTFDLNGGTLDDENFNGTLIDGATDKYVITVDYGTQVTYPKIKHSDEKVQSSWQVVKGNTGSVNSDTEVKAIWTGLDGKAEHTVTFVLGKENVTYTGELKQTIKMFEGATAPVVEDLPNYKFDGWDFTFDRIVADMTITARWVKIITLKFVDTIYNNKCNDIIVKSNAKIGELPVLKDSTDEYTFKGWYYLDGEKKVTVTSETILQVDETELTLYANWSSNWTGFY